MDTLCWTCQNAVPIPEGKGCNWSRNLKPVEGWEAKKTIKRPSEGRMESYCVRSCPEYIPDPVKWKPVRGPATKSPAIAIALPQPFAYLLCKGVTKYIVSKGWRLPLEKEAYICATKINPYREISKMAGLQAKAVKKALSGKEPDKLPLSCVVGVAKIKSTYLVNEQFLERVPMGEKLLHRMELGDCAIQIEEAELVPPVPIICKSRMWDLSREESRRIVETWEKGVYRIFL